MHAWRPSAHRPASGLTTADDIAGFPAARSQRAAGAVVVHDGRLVAVGAFTVWDGCVAAIDGLNDPERLATLDVSHVGL